MIADSSIILYTIPMIFSDQTSILSRTRLFESWDEKSLDEAEEFCSLERFSQGSVVFKDGEDGNAVFIVKDGEIAVTRMANTGWEQEIARYVPGDSFGELDMLTRVPRNAEARAARTSELIRFPCRGKSMDDFLKDHPAAGARFFDSCLEILAGRLRKAAAVIAENAPWVRELRNQVYQDKLTGLFNKTFLVEQLPLFLKDEPLSLMMIQPDNFREIGETYGRAAEDEALILIASALSRVVTEAVEVCRFEGDEFACVFPGMDIDGARDMAEIIRVMLNNLDLSPITSLSTFHLTVSTGIAVYPACAGEAETLIDLARGLLPIGRSRGGNKILSPDDR
jgi:diguanylate cyclase (GGDEF)-like protein